MILLELRLRLEGGQDSSKTCHAMLAQACRTPAVAAEHFTITVVLCDAFEVLIAHHCQQTRSTRHDEAHIGDQGRLKASAIATREGYHLTIAA